MMSVVRLCWMVIFGCLFTSTLLGGIGQWKTFTSKRQVRDIAVDSRDSLLVWVASNGGMFAYHINNGTFQEFTTSEGLRTTDLTAISTDDFGAIWIGAADGMIHRYLPITNEWMYITDLFVDKDHGSNKRINKFSIMGDTLFILSDIGISIYSISKLQFHETYTRFGSAPYEIVGNVTSAQIFNDMLWIGTRYGTASTPMTNPNPLAPDSWKIYTKRNGLPESQVNILVILDGQLVAGTAGGLAYFDSVRWNFLPASPTENIISVQTNQQLCFDCASAYFITQNGLWMIYEELNIGLINQFDVQLSSVLSEKILGTETQGLIILKDTMWISVIPPGPSSNKFVSIAVDNRSVLWAATGTANGDGFMSFNGSDWRSYTVEQDARLGSNNYYKVSIGRDNSKWISNWGEGVAMLDDVGNLQKVFNTTNGLPPTLIGDTTYIVVGGVAVDKNGTTWITNRTAPDSTAVTLFLPDSTFDYSVKLSMREPLTIFPDLVIDNNDTKWFTNSGRFDHESPQGLLFYNDKDVPPGVASGWNKLTFETSNQVFSLAVDNNGELWVGSDQGITIIFSTNDPNSSTAVYYPLRDQTIQAIVPDVCDNKWIATKQGVFVLSPDGTSIVERYTVENTDGKLLDNDVASIAIDHNTGRVYFGTEKGLSSFMTSSVAPKQSFGELFFMPNPYYIPSTSSLTVDGLVYSSSIKVITVSGDLVRNIQCPCGRIGFWDGTDEHGDLVSTGIYFVIAYAADGTEVASGKLAVIRK